MDIEKQKNKFNFFKTAPRSQPLGFSNLKDANDYTTLLIVGLWILSGLFFKIDMRAQQIQETHKVQAVTSIELNSVDAQEKLKFIAQVKSLKSAALYDVYDGNTPILLKDINKDLKVMVTNATANDDSLEVKGYILGSSIDSKKKIELFFSDELISVKWVGVTPDEIKTFTNAWKGDVQTEVRTNAGNTKETVLIANILKMQASPLAVETSSKIKALESQLEKLKEENLKLKKNNADMVVKKAVQDNPQLKLQEKEIQKFVDRFLDVSKGK